MRDGLASARSQNMSVCLFPRHYICVIRQSKLSMRMAADRLKSLLLGCRDDSAFTDGTIYFQDVLVTENYGKIYSSISQAVEGRNLRAALRRCHSEEAVVGDLGHDLVLKDGGDDHTSRGERRGGGEQESKGGLHFD